jgi:uncharacterized protein (DUF2249 family)
VTTLDLRTVPAALRHDQVFARLDVLALGEVLELVVDHRPTPLRYELEATRPGDYEWADGEDGPRVWSARITCRARIVDARPILDRGEEPFQAIMSAVGETGPGERLVVLAPFEPVPLEGVLSSQGFTYDARELPGGDWRVTFESPPS